MQNSFRIMSYQTKEQTCFSVSGLCYCWIFFYISLHGSIALPLTILPILCSSVSRFQALGVICALCDLSNKFLFCDMFFKSFCIKRISLTNPSMCCKLLIFFLTSVEGCRTIKKFQTAFLLICTANFVLRIRITWVCLRLQDYKKFQTAFLLICTTNFVLRIRITLHLLKEFATVTSLFKNEKKRLYLISVIISSVSGICSG